MVNAIRRDNHTGWTLSPPLGGITKNKIIALYNKYYFLTFPIFQNQPGKAPSSYRMAIFGLPQSF